MNIFKPSSTNLSWLFVLLCSTLATGCGGGGEGRSPILGTGGIAVLVPTVTAVAPVNNATGVAVNAVLVAAFSTEMAATSISASTFTLACPVSTPITGNVTYASNSRSATFSPSVPLPAGVTCTATIGASAMDSAGVPLGNNFVWSFRTALAADNTRPSVISTVPVTTSPGQTSGIPTNTAITAIFTEDILPATISTASFLIACPAPCVSPTGSVSYVVGSRTAMFTPATPLAAGTNYTVTITSAVTDLAGNALAGNQVPLPSASNYAWTFLTSGPIAPANISVQSTNPATNASGVCSNATINATLSLPSGLRLDPSTVNSATFTVKGPGPVPVPVTAASVAVDSASGHIATFTPISALTTNIVYTATLKGGVSGVKDLSIPGNVLANDFTWSFTAGGACQPPILAGGGVSLVSASSFGTFGGSAGITNQGVLTVINGDIGTTAVSTAVTGFHDAGPGCTYTETPLNVGFVNGKIYTAAPPPTPSCPSEGNATTFAIATRARADALDAYNALVAQPGGPDPAAGNLGSLVLAPGVYTASSGSFMIRGGNLTLDAQGNTNAVWVFQMATTLTVGGPGAAFPQSVTLANGAQAKNVFWQVGSAATINAGGGGTMVGTIISQEGVAISTAGNVAVSILNGRALSLGASVTIVNTVVNVPAP